MNKDNLSTAFELISDEIETLAVEIAKEGGEAFSEKRYTDAQQLAKTGEKLKSFKAKVDRLLDEWENDFDHDTRTKTNISKISNTTHPSSFVIRSERSGLQVTFEDGTEIAEKRGKRHQSNVSCF